MKYLLTLSLILLFTGIGLFNLINIGVRDSNINLAQKYENPKDVPEAYLSYALDMAQVLGGKWWEGSLDFTSGRGGRITKPFNFNREELDRMIRPLSPFTLRLGGSEADSALYDIHSTREKLTDEEKEKGFQTILNKTKLENIKNFLDRNQIDLFLTLNIGPGYRDNGELNLKSLEEFIRDLSKVIPNIKAFELGNEINAFFLNYGWSGQISEEQYVDDYRAVKKIIKKYYPEAKLAGAANAFWPVIGEVFSNFTVDSFNVMAKLTNELDIYTWHYYPTQSVRCPARVRRASEERMKEAIFDEGFNDLLYSIKEATSKAKVKEVWLGETGPAQCGGEPKISKSFSSALWFFDHIFKVLSSGQSKLIRQTLVGSDYGLINDRSLSANYDYYIARIYNWLELKKYFKVSDSDHYSFCDQSNRLIHVFPLVSGREINLDRKYQHIELIEADFKIFNPTDFENQIIRKVESLDVKSKIFKRKSLNILRTETQSEFCI